MEIFKLFGRILVDDKEAQNSLSRTDKNTKSLGERLRGGIKMAALWGTALVGAAVGVGAAMFGLVNKATQAADAIAKGAARMGVSTDFYQEMDYWASQNGLSHDQMEKAIGRFNQRIGKALDGNDKYSNALERLGVNLDEVRDGSISTEDAFAKSIQTLSEMENEHEKVALATEMFGDAMARDLLPALQDGSLSIEEARKKAQELGLVLSEDQIKASEEFQDSWDTIKRSLGAAATQIGLDLMPMFQKLLDWVIDKLPAIREMFSKVFGFIREASLWVVERVQLIMDWLSQWFDDNQSSLAGIWDTFLHYLTLVKDFVEEAFVFIKQIIKDILDAVVPFIQEQLDKIMKFWEENGKQIMQAVQNVFNFIKGVIEFIFPIIVAIIQGAWGLIKNAFDTAVNIIMGIVKVFSSLLTGDFEGVRSALIGIWKGLSLYTATKSP